MKLRLSCIMMLTIFVCATVPASIQAERAGIMLTDEVQLKLGDGFAAEGDFYRAITEYKKLLILFPDSAKADTARFKVGMAYYKGEEYEAAEQAFASLGNISPESIHAASAAYQQGLCFAKLGKPDKAAQAFETARKLSTSRSDTLRQAVFGKVLAAFDQHDISEGQKTLELYLQKQPDNSGAVQAVGARSLLDQYQELPRKSPLVAGTLSAIIPGSGHIYAGHYGDGVTALLLNGLFIAGTVVAAQQENYPAAGLLGLIGLPFYIGNIYGGANAAVKLNVGMTNELRSKLVLSLGYPF